MPPATDYFALFDILPSLSIDTIALRKKFYELNKQYHPDRISAQDEAAQTEALAISAQLNIAYRTLSDEDALLGYVLRREGVLQDDEHYQLPPEFLMEMMELNEALDSESGKEAYEEARTNWTAGIAPLRRQYEHGQRDEPVLKALKDFYFRKKYLNRIKGRLA